MKLTPISSERLLVGCVNEMVMDELVYEMTLSRLAFVHVYYLVAFV